MLKHTRAAMTHFDSKDQAQPLQISENGARHTRAMRSHFWSEEQTMALKSSERCLEHTRTMISRFGSKEQASMPRFTMALQSLGKYLKHTKW